MSNTADVLAEVELGQNAGGAGGSIENCAFNGNGNATITKNGIYVNNTGNNVVIRGVQATGTGITFGQDFGPIYVEDNYVDCASVAGCVPVVLDQSGSITFISGIYAHPGAASPSPIFDVLNDTNVVNTNILWLGVGTETTNSTDIAFDLPGCAQCGIYSSYNSEAGGLGAGTDSILIAGLSNNITIENYKNIGGATNTLVDSTMSPTFTVTAASDTLISHYEPGQFAAPGQWAVAMPQQYPNPTEETISSLPTCSAANRGLTGYSVTNATVPCAWMGTPVPTASPSQNYPVGCFHDTGSTYTWRCKGN